MAEETQLADYLLERRLGEGRVADVFLAQRRQGGGHERLVLKRLRVDAAQEEGVVALFLEEARRVAPALHPNLAQVIDVGAEDGVAYLVEEHVDGPSLEALTRALSERQELLPIEVCVDLAVQLCRALQALHDEAGRIRAVHGAISPWSVRVSFEGAVKLTDFGVERVVTRLNGVRAGLAEPRFGYHAPEALRDEEVDARADQHAVGVLLWELLTGRRLFHASPAAARENVLVAPVAPPSSIRRSVPPALDSVVLRALERTPAARFPDVAMLEHALEVLVPPLGVDDREARIRAELQRLWPSQAPEAAPAAPFVEGDGGALDVERSVAVGPGAIDPSYDPRALSLEGSEPQVHPRATTSGKGRRRSRGVAALLALALVVGGATYVVWRFSDELRTQVGRLLAAASSSAASSEPDLGSSSSSTSQPPVAAKAASPRERAQADRLERRAAELLLEGQHRRALVALHEAVELAPERPSLHRKLAMAYHALDERYLARRHLEHYLALSPRAPDRAAVEAQLAELGAD